MAELRNSTTTFYQQITFDGILIHLNVMTFEVETASLNNMGINN
jgi:hypothetical protein